MAGVLGARADACRQRYHRARRKIAGLPQPQTPPAGQRRLLERLSEAMLAGDRAQLTALLADDAVVLSDGGGVVSAALRPVTDTARIAQVLIHLAGQADVAAMTFEWQQLNGGVGLLILEHGAPFACLQVAGAADDPDLLSRLYAVRNPDKLRRLPVGTHWDTTRLPD
jgi:RNA polymerase sigma-70 factor (ECF subfamily)